MKNHWLSRRDQRERRLRLMDDALIVYRLVRFSGKFQEADPVNRQGRIYSYPEHLKQWYSDRQKLRKDSQDGKPATKA
jgi:hypothetical protein